MVKCVSTPLVVAYLVSRRPLTAFHRLLTLPLIVGALSAHAANDPCELRLLANSAQVQTSQQNIVYVNGVSEPGQILWLTGPEYREKALHDQISPTTILVVEDIPLDIDLPVCAGLIVAKPLPVRQTHVEFFAKKMGIPFAYVENPSRELVASVNSGDFFTLKAKRSEKVVLQPANPPSNWRARAVVPRRFDRTPIFLADVNNSAHIPRAQVGDKFQPLAGLRRETADNPLTPSLRAISSGFFEHFLDKYQYQGRTLRKFIAEKLKDPDDAGHSDLTHRLAEIRMAIREAQLTGGEPNVLQKLLQPLEKVWDRTARVSVRSNNEFEDLIGAGVFASAVAESLEPDAILAAAKTVFESMYTYRAINIYRARGLLTENLSMPLLIHPFISGEAFNGLATFRLQRSGRFILEVSLVEGGENRATSPHGAAQSFRVAIAEKVDGSGAYSVRNLWPLPIDPAVEEGLTNLFSRLKSSLVRSFHGRIHRPESVELEFLLMPDGPKYQPLVLQYKNTLSREDTAKILRGELDRDAAEDLIARSAFDQLEPGYKQSLEQMGFLPMRVQLFELNSSSNLRYAMVELDGSSVFLAWRSKEHLIMKKQLETVFGAHIKWVRSGYVRHEYDKNALVFSNGFFSDSIDANELSREQLQGHLARALLNENTDGRLLAFLVRRQIKTIEVVEEKTSILSFEVRGDQIHPLKPEGTETKKPFILRFMDWFRKR